MPQSDYNASQNVDSIGGSNVVSQIPNTCPNPMTPPPERNEHHAPFQLSSEHSMRYVSGPRPDNTAAAMAQSQEDSAYLSPAASPTDMSVVYHVEEQDKMDGVQEGGKDGAKTPALHDTYGTEDNSLAPSVPHITEHIIREHAVPDHYIQSHAPRSHILNNETIYTTHEAESTMDSLDLKDKAMDMEEEAISQGLAPIDLTFNRQTITQPWTFSERRLRPEYPSHVFQSFSRYSGTQQSDRQIYNVDVTILTVDISQCTMAGYLLIRGLTPEHDTLQTYFTGEIIGGPPRFAGEKQTYTFRTANAAWGATEKTDLTHWARFPAWRSLSSYAKRDINFTYPMDGGNWWQQENIFMRWKEHFLVPDHKTRSIAGASFEGFYYICLNQVQGRISGIYYHSKSEKYQQLELKHEGQPEIFNRGVTPCVEFR